MALLKRFGIGLRKARKNRDLTQEDFSSASSRTYLSSLERAIKAPTITKIDQIASVIGVHPLSIVAYAYLPSYPTGRNEFCAKTIASDQLSSAKMKRSAPPQVLL